MENLIALPVTANYSYTINNAPENDMDITMYREQTEDLRIMVNNFHSCVDNIERAVLIKNASQFVSELVDCTRKTSRDKDLRDIALREVIKLLCEDKKESVSVTRTTTKTTNTRAFNYNKSPSRAVRMRRAAKTARKSACWH
jgi:hypothetical protein